MEIEQKPTQKRISPGKKKRITKKNRFIEAYLRNKGHITEACKEAEINRGTYYGWMKDESFVKLFNESLESFHDEVQRRILKLAMNDDKDMLKFWAKTQMRHRGFGDKQEIELSGKIDTLSKEQIEEEIKRLLE